jgi:hypothetical protein
MLTLGCSTPLIFDIEGGNHYRESIKLASAEAIIREITRHYKVDKPVSDGKFKVYPLIGQVTTPVIGLSEAEDTGKAWVQESEIENVDTIEAINTGEVPVLIPYLSQVQGGKQDRTVFEPIIVPTGRGESNPLQIPARCIERSRWGYQSSRGVATSQRFSSARTRMGSQMAFSVSSRRDQGAVWDNISSALGSMRLDSSVAPTLNWREMNEEVHRSRDGLKDTWSKLLPGTQVPDQVGILVVYENKILALEVYGSNRLWSTFSEEVLKGFLLDSYFLEEESDTGPEEDIEPILEFEFKSMQVNPDSATGAGELFRLTDKSWQGMALLLDGVPIHLYAVKRHTDTLEGQSKRRRLRTSDSPGGSIDPRELSRFLQEEEQEEEIPTPTTS